MSKISQELSILFFEVFFETERTRSLSPHTVITFNPLFWGFLWNIANFRVKPVKKIIFQSSFLRFSLKPILQSQTLPGEDKTFNPLFWGFLWNEIIFVIFEHASDYPFNPLFWGFLWNYLPQILLANRVLQRNLSILFFEVFFETNHYCPILLIQEYAFNPLFWGFLWNKALPISHQCSISYFQSSFLRFSLKLTIRAKHSSSTDYSFNPLFWGFLWNSKLDVWRT